jgi:FKBP-type peptidyl-prolyl cis-trans isomerase (trigger factor)
MATIWVLARPQPVSRPPCPRRPLDSLLAMKAVVEPLEGNKVKLSVEVDEEEFEKAVDAAFRKIAREVRIPGFRPGKAPRRILEARLGKETGRSEALRDSLPDYYSRALREHDVDAIAPPEIDITAGQESGPVAFDAVVEVRPPVHLVCGSRFPIPRSPTRRWTRRSTACVGISASSPR